MCLILFSYRATPGYRLVLTANRDEFYDRPTAPMHIWQDGPAILAGRDLKAGGTWLGVDSNKRFAALTNVRNPADVKPNSPSRGDIVTDFLNRELPAEGFLKELGRTAERFNGFNLLVMDGSGLFWYSNKGPGPRKLASGIFGLSNALLNTDWPKVTQGRNALEASLKEHSGPDSEALFTMLKDEKRPHDSRLPDTGVGLDCERLLSPRFIKSPTYGTRSSTVLTLNDDGRLVIEERSFDPADPERSPTNRFVL